MAKKKKGGNGFDDILSNPFGMNDEEMKALMLFGLVNLGVTPDEYRQAYEKLHDVGPEEIFGSDDESPADEPHIMTPFNPFMRGYGSQALKPMEDAAHKSLRLKIQMKDVTKPPMWREVIVPADFTFVQLHYVIQAVTGLNNCHLWQFQDKAYQSSYCIGIPREDEFGFGLEDATDNADETPLTSYLTAKDDKIEYVYDFGDDWIFQIKLLDILDRKSEVAELTKWKCDIQPLDNSGGIYNYCEIRSLLDGSKKMSAKQKKDYAKRLYFDSYDEMMEYYTDQCLIAPEQIAEQLAEIPDAWVDID